MKTVLIEREGTHTHALRRFAGRAIEPERVIDLKASHPALTDGRSIFRKSVVHVEDSPRLLVAGYNNPKLGAKIQKGPFEGFPIFHLTLEERATCPTSCHMWNGYYGNAMPFARRHAIDNVVDFGMTLDEELAALQRKHPKGFMIRLHTLGDFASVAYVRLWAVFLVRYPALHCFGYTSNWHDADDPVEREIGQAILALTEASWERFAIRFSTQAAKEQTAVVIEANDSRPNVLPCPAQTKKSECCATCGLCWAESVRDRSIGFLKHGMKRTRGRRK